MGKQLLIKSQPSLFGKGLSSSLQTIFQLTGISKIGGLSRYLGLPEQIGRNKNDTFSYISQRIQNKLENWYSKFLSPAEKDVLLKAIVTAIPTYVMACFLLPYKLVEKITQTIRKFWWSADPHRDKIAWIAWEKVAQSKQAGGLGIRDLWDFNISLIAKQGWRFLKHPHSLLAQVYRAKYYRKASFLEAKKHRQSSYAWKVYSMANNC